MVIIFREKNPTDPRLQTYAACSAFVGYTRRLISGYLSEIGFSQIAHEGSETGGEDIFKRRCDGQ